MGIPCLDYVEFSHPMLVSCVGYYIVITLSMWRPSTVLIATLLRFSILPIICLIGELVAISMKIEHDGCLEQPKYVVQCNE